MASKPINFAEQNLIFAGLGLQLGILSKEKVIRAFTEWLFDKSKPLAEISIQQKALTVEQANGLQVAVHAHIEQEGDSGKALASLHIAKDLESDLDHLGDNDLQQTLDSALTQRKKLGLDDHFSKSHLSNESPLVKPAKPGEHEIQVKDRFVREGFFDAGNLGELYFARDTELNRTVVAKYIKPERANENLTQALFHLEGEVTGCLEHPGIVPVYGLGKDTRDRLFYAMRYIRGRKLSRVISEYQGILNSESGKKREALVDLLQNFQAACLAIEYAHKKGVLHCDIKPDNIMIGDYGEVFVVDWGLVVIHGQSLSSPVENSDAFETLEVGQVPPYRPSEAASSGLHKNQGGSRRGIGGTPAYMAPEQLMATRDDDISLIGPASDIYALGGTLFQILAGKAPHLSRKNSKETIEDFNKRILNGDFPRPSDLKPETPRALEAIALKALSLNPKDRYGSARELAEDVKRYLADEPVNAHREGLAEKTLRFARKNRTAVGVAAALLLCLALGGTLFGFITKGFNRELQGFNEKLRISEREARENAELVIKNEALAKKREASAIEAVKLYAKSVNENPELKNRPEFDSLRKELLKEPIRFFKELEQQLRTEANASSESKDALASGLFELGYLVEAIGNQENAIEVYQRAVKIREELVSANPSNFRYQENLLTSYHTLGFLCENTNRESEAEELFKRILKIREKFVINNPENIQTQNDLAMAHNNLGRIYEKLNRESEAEESFLRALKIWEDIARVVKGGFYNKDGLATSNTHLGYLYQNRNRLRDAEESFLRALKIWENLVAANPKNIGHQNNLATAFNNLGNVYKNTKRENEALQFFKKALKTNEEIVNAYPSNPEYQNFLAISYTNLGSFYLSTKQTREGQQAFKKALEIEEEIARTNPTNSLYQITLASFYQSFGHILYLDVNRVKEVEDFFKKALRINQKVANENPNNAMYQNNLAASYNSMGFLQDNTGRFKEAEKSYQQAISIMELLVLKNPSNKLFKQSLDLYQSSLKFLQNKKRVD